MKMENVGRWIFALVVGLLTCFASWQLTWTIPQLSYRVRTSAMKSTCLSIKPGMNGKAVVTLMQERAFANVELEVPGGLYFYGNGSCEIAIDSSTKTVSRAAFKKEEETIATAK